MKKSILAHLGQRITKQQELLATEGLTYLLQQSDSCASVLRKLAHGAGCNLVHDISYHAEVSGEDQERPDVVGTNSDGLEISIIEGKFFAGLTANQPNAYLHRLADPNKSMLLFVVPERRTRRLWKEITTRASQDWELYGFGEGFGNSLHCKTSNDMTLSIISWGEILEHMMTAAQAAGDEIVSDVYQLQSLCNKIEGEAFLPFSSEELTGLNQPRRHRDMCDLVDEITSRLKNRDLISLDGLKATPQRDGYTRYVWLGARGWGGGAFLALRYDLWLQTELSPFWLGTQNNGTKTLLPLFREQAASLGSEVVEVGGRPHLPIPVKADLEFDEAVEEAVSIVADIVAALKTKVENQA